MSHLLLHTEAMYWSETLFLGSEKECFEIEHSCPFCRVSYCVSWEPDHAPERVTTDGHASYPRAVREILGDQVCHRTNKYLNNGLEQDHRGSKQRYYPMHGFGSFNSAVRFCSAFDELRNCLRLRSTTGELASPSERRQAYLHRLTALKKAMQVVS